MYIAGDTIVTNAEDNLGSINNSTIRNRIQDAIDDMQSATAENIEYLSMFYQYSWILIIIIVTFTLFVLARKVVETKGYGGVV